LNTIIVACAIGVVVGAALMFWLVSIAQRPDQLDD
jgi:hypothetical protein